MNKNTTLLLVIPALVSLTTACATKENSNMDKHEQTDSFETYNRAMFKFNYRADKYVIKPLAKGYRAITNDFTRARIDGILSTIKEPVYAVNNLLQGEPKKSGINLSRTVVNATLGLGGMFDVAQGWGLKKEKTSFDNTLASWCVADGPFIVLPIMGPSTPRAATGLLADSAMNPVYLGTLDAPANVKDKIYYSYTALSGIALREANLELLDDLERNSVDFYATMRSAYLQNRQNMSCYSKKQTGTVSYDFDFNDEVYDEMEAK